MKVLIVIFIIVTFAARAQQSVGWLTPFATVEFTHNRIHYYFVSETSKFWLAPRFIPVEILQLHVVCTEFFSAPDEAIDWKQAIREDAEGHNFAALSRDEKFHFLKAFTLQSIWGINNTGEMPSQNAWSLASGLSAHNDKEIFDAAKLAAGLYEIIILKLREQRE